MSRAVHCHRNISDATLAALRDLLAKGKSLKVRGQEVLELRNRVTVLERPLERCLFLPRRGDNVFGQIAETLWVIGGRNDVGWLETYLPRARDFSDDGSIWRAAYGPRLRRWSGVDQFRAVRDLIHGEKETRRAVMALFDPACDYVASRDIPCNNWLHWLIRDDRLHLNVALRSNDVMWGFSGVNSFEWSVLHQAMAQWCGVVMGEVTYLASSFHLYQHHFEKAQQVVGVGRRPTCYDFGLVAPSWSTPLEGLDAALKVWFRIEEELRKDLNTSLDVTEHLGDPWLANAAALMHVFLGHAAGWDVAQLRTRLERLPETDLSAAAYEHLARKEPGVLQDIPQPKIARFIGQYTSTQPPVLDEVQARTYLKRVHAQKNSGYGNAWKKRGEMTSILANVARKVDRIEQFMRTGAMIDGESLVDTALDLFVYLTKYRLFLLEQAPALTGRTLPAGAPTPFSDHVANFDALVDGTVAADTGPSAAEVARDLMIGFAALHALAERGTDAREKLVAVSELAGRSLRYYFLLAEQHGVPA